MNYLLESWVSYTPTLKVSFLGHTLSHNRNLLTQAHMSLSGLRRAAASITYWIGTYVLNNTLAQYSLIVLGLKV